MLNPEVLNEALSILKDARRVAVLTGAGVSAESGVPTFRASDGLWEGHPIEKVATPYGFADDPALVWKFYNMRRHNLRSVKPNPGHFALAAFEKHWGKDFTLVTQNVDGLHRIAGNQRVLEIHGNIYRTRCSKCYMIEDRGLEPLDDLPQCNRCQGMLRPDIVWFHEPLPEEIWSQAMEAASTCDVLLVVGTSAVVYPAASLIPVARQSRSRGAKVIECNLTRTEASWNSDLGLYGPSGQTLPQICAGLGLSRP